MRRRFRPPALSPLPNREKVSLGPEWPMPTLLTQRAHVTFTARDAAGRMLDSVVKTLLPGGHDAHGMSGLFGLPFSGSLEVTSTAPIVSLSINLESRSRILLFASGGNYRHSGGDARSGGRGCVQRSLRW